MNDADTNIEEGKRQLAHAVKLKSAMLPIGGAVIGSLVAGPVGLLAGLKIGCLACVTGGIVGKISCNHHHQRKLVKLLYFSQ